MLSACVHAKSLLSCPTLCHPMDCSPPGSSVHGILQARILEWVAMPSSRGSSRPRDWTHISCTAGRFSITEPPGKPQLFLKQKQKVKSPADLEVTIPDPVNLFYVLFKQKRELETTEAWVSRWYLSLFLLVSISIILRQGWGNWISVCLLSGFELFCPLGLITAKWPRF